MAPNPSKAQSSSVSPDKHRKSSKSSSHGRRTSPSSSSGRNGGSRGVPVSGASSSGRHSPQGGSSTSRVKDDHIPYSLKDAPPELRPAIKRKQNREHAKRSRERKRAEEEDMIRKLECNDARIRMLEQQVETLTEELRNDPAPNGMVPSARYDRREVPSSPSTKPGFYGDPF
ncbi:hypothetical protein BWQ96_00512 [Gracilariopsis chorda]|uniref:BZIP domain-containing protein n=1 Tax=Gracilariopsis chorda TaxID=448386 RepID=A0A2V3J5H8_9FLOR|nr:hypothetical protein BWQ96_00512 [Gracilariopsis chorda]|eukprot:PXF49634.1 hypothetical protein BWQ96_00512 [Gracilariopsis chorda]